MSIRNVFENARRGFVLAALLLLAGARGEAAVPALINYQGQLSDAGGPMSGSFPMSFAIYGAPTGGTPLWSESYASVNVTAGVFNVLLGSVTALPIGSVFTGQNLWIETTVAGNVLSPRRPIVSTPYSVMSWLSQIAQFAQSAQVALTGPGAVYTRWGRTTCPPGQTELVYQGHAAGSRVGDTGGGRNTLCMAGTPEWAGFDDVTNEANAARVYGTTYNIGSSGLASVPPFDFLHGEPAPCAVCFATSARVVLMIPGTNQCPNGWMPEYDGYLMATHHTQTGSEFVCVDRDAESSGVGSGEGLEWHPTEGHCGVLPCPPYVQSRELTCVVCTRP